MKKTTHQILLATSMVVAFISASQLQAQSQMSAPGGIAASPRTRQMLEETPAARVQTPAPVVVSAQPAPNVSIAASPRVRQVLDERRASEWAATIPSSTISTTRHTDNLAASPRLREQLQERPTQFQIAPLK